MISISVIVITSVIYTVLYHVWANYKITYLFKNDLKDEAEYFTKYSAGRYGVQLVLIWFASLILVMSNHLHLPFGDTSPTRESISLTLTLFALLPCSVCYLIACCDEVSLYLYSKMTIFNRLVDRQYRIDENKYRITTKSDEDNWDRHLSTILS